MLLNALAKCLESKDQGTEFEFTVVQKLNQGTNPGKRCNLSWVSFFVSFLDKQKRKNKINENELVFNRITRSDDLRLTE